MVTDTDSARNIGDMAGWVIYDKSEQEVFARKILEQISNTLTFSVQQSSVIQKAIVAAACFIKHKGFEQEKEFRVLKFPDSESIQFREAQDRLVPYLDILQGKKSIPIKKIIIGPGWQLLNLKHNQFFIHHVTLGIRRLLDSRLLHDTEIARSGIPYDPR